MAFGDYLVLFLEDPLKKFEILMGKLKEVGELVCFKINEQKTEND